MFEVGEYYRVEKTMFHDLFYFKVLRKRMKGTIRNNCDIVIRMDRVAPSSAIIFSNITPFKKVSKLEGMLKVGE